MNKEHEGAVDVAAQDDRSVSFNKERTTTVQQLNDRFRRGLSGGVVMVTSGISALGFDQVQTILRSVREFSSFIPDNDPYSEHDFGAFEQDGHRFFWKIDYFDASLTAGSEDPADPTKTRRVLTVMLADEY